MGYVIEGLAVEPFQAFFGLADAELAKHNVLRVVASSSQGFPCRVKLQDAPKGESLLLINHEYQPAPTPYQGRHAIFVSESATAAARHVNEVPAVLTSRKVLSLRGFDPQGLMVDADLVAGPDVEQLILKLFENQDIAYIHAHNAGRGCFAARIDRS